MFYPHNRMTLLFTPPLAVSQDKSTKVRTVCTNLYCILHKYTFFVFCRTMWTHKVVLIQKQIPVNCDDYM